MEAGDSIQKGRTELIVALDFADPTPALDLIEKLDGLPVIFKIGSELFMNGGAPLVEELTQAQKRVFLDLKFYDIPNTVAKAAAQAAGLQVEMFTLHLSGGRKMIEAVKKEISIYPARPKILGVSVLTSFDQRGWSEVTYALTGHEAEIETSVVNLARAASTWGVDGLVCSPHELERLKNQTPDLYTIVPGIRPQGTESQDQARVMTPSEAAERGASAIVVGRPITQSLDPRLSTEAILDELK